MKFTRVDDDAIQRTQLQGYVTTTYERLVTAFGEPDRCIGPKTRVEWDIRFEDGTIAAIYDWKQHDVEVENVAEWNVGGHTTQAVTLVESELWSQS